MSKRKNSKRPATFTEIIMRQRGSWGNVNPVTRRIEDGRRKPPKYPHKMMEE